MRDWLGGEIFAHKWRQKEIEVIDGGNWGTIVVAIKSALHEKDQRKLEKSNKKLIIAKIVNGYMQFK